MKITSGSHASVKLRYHNRNTKNNKKLCTIERYILLYNNENREKGKRKNKFIRNSVNSAGYSSSQLLFSGYNRMEYLGIIIENRANYTPTSLMKPYH